MRRADFHSRLRGNDVSKVIPAAFSPRESGGGIHTALTEDEGVVAGTGGEVPCMTAGADSLTVDGFRGSKYA